MNCHGTAGMTMVLGDGTMVSVQVDAKRFMGSVHGPLGCSGCHKEVSLDKHPSAKYSTRWQFQRRLTAVCRTCHSDDQLTASPAHQSVVSRPNAPPCSQCHSAHAVQKAARRKAHSSISQHCLTCHSKELTKAISGERLSLTLGEGWITGSVHRSHECSDCHAGYSKDFHPQPPPVANVRKFALSAAETCKRCHFDKAVQYRDSIHATLSMQGNQQAPVCTDCHGAHTVGPHALAETLDGMPCKKCHQADFSAYRASIHGMRKSAGDAGAPLCAGCHRSHDVKAAAVSLSPRDRCMACHADVAAGHREWLPNPQAHFELVACTACHVPADRRRSIYLRLVDEGTGKLLSDDDVHKLMQARGIAEGLIGPKDLWWIFQRLNEDRRTGVAVAVSMTDPVTAHDIREKGAALKSCERCHSADAAFFGTVAVVTAGPDGREMVRGAAPDILGSAYGVVLLKRFYVMSGTRLTFMDYARLFIILGGLAVPVAHGTALLLTARLRRKERRE
jgi:nitrate/TMAO reductase-like tetraheme cytochrome c subunit